QESSDGLEEHHHVAVPAMVASKKKHAEDILTIFLEKCSVKFVHTDSRVEMLTGCLCSECWSDEKFVWACGKQKAFHVGSNSSCHQHIHGHFDVYKA
ncbi:hypothetical protein EDC04DRAFT_2576528, partial [Pisolithus marmoratus]